MRDQKRYSHLWPWLLLLPPLRRRSALDHQAPAPAPAPTAAVRLVASASEAAKEETPVRFYNLPSAVEHLFSFKLENSGAIPSRPAFNFFLWNYVMALLWI